MTPTTPARSQSEQSLGLRAALLTILATSLRLRARALAILELSPIASDTAHSPTTSRIASGSPRNRCDHCLDCEETLPLRSLTESLQKSLSHSQALAAGAIGSALCARASNPWILGTIVSAAAHSPTRCRIASATARNRRHVARIASSAARNPRLCSDCERAGSCLLYTSPSPRDVEESRMPSSA